MNSVFWEGFWGTKFRERNKNRWHIKFRCCCIRTENDLNGLKVSSQKNAFIYLITLFHFALTFQLFRNKQPKTIIKQKQRSLHFIWLRNNKNTNNMHCTHFSFYPLYYYNSCNIVSICLQITRISLSIKSYWL